MKKTSEKIHDPNVHSSTTHNSQDMKQPKCPLTDKWIKKMLCVYIYIMEYYSAIKKNERNAICINIMDLEIIILNQISQAEKDKYHATYTWNPKYGTNEPIYKRETDHGHGEQTFGCQEGGSGMDWELGVSRCKL